MDLQGRVIVITGASAGLGAGMARWFADEGASLGLCARREPEAPTAETIVQSVDVTDPSGLRRFASAVSQGLGPIDLWINNAAVVGPIVPQRSLAPADLIDHLEINLVGVLNGTQAFLSQLDVDDHRGALVNISSGLAQKGRAGLSAYAAAKAGVERLTEVVAVEEIDRLKIALAVSPGVIATQMQSTLRSQSPDILHDVDMFQKFHAEDAWNSPAWIAGHMARWVFEEAPDQVVVRVPPESQ
ncbi:MAG: SDR family NAD(P)-dependent oxidoreductase [Acidimicrobiia bacterium]